jgi:hypothetical protein
LYYLINATTQIQKNLGRTVSLLQELLEINQVLEEAWKRHPGPWHADDGIRKMRLWEKPGIE